MNVLLLSLYDLGRQPFGLASAAAWLGEAGASVRCADLAVESLDEAVVREARLIALHVPMHTATRLACALLPRLRALSESAHICLFGLYAPLNDGHLRALGADSVLGGEVETALVALYRRLAGAPSGRSAAPTTVSLPKQRFGLPDRTGLPDLGRYAHLVTADGGRVVAGHTEASRGCKHLCRHCPIPPVYDGAFRIVQADVVMADIRRQVAAGAGHITFGDPDFFNGVGHAMRLVTTLHEEFPALRYDVTVKIEHLLKHARHLPALAETGCLFVTSAVESVDDRILAYLDKGHTRADFLRAAALMRDAGLTLAPTFVPFTPWTTLDGYLDLLRAVAALGLVDNTAPIQLAIRLLVPRGSLLVPVMEREGRLGPFDAEALCYRWRSEDPTVDRLQTSLIGVVEDGEAAGHGRGEIFREIWAHAHREAGLAALPPAVGDGAPVPRMSEPWFCCAEPTSRQLGGI